MDRIGPYITQRKLGTGGMGTVYLAYHEETGESAAVKLLPASLAREPGFLARFDREITALQQLESPNIVKIFESGVISDESDDENNAYYYAMEFVDGETLLTMLRRERRLDWRTTIDYGVQICVALKAAHDRGIIHRDLKPSNLLITNDGCLKLADFGVAQVFASTRLTKTGGVIGTAEFMSPEQAQGHRATKKSDLYALGAVLYTMLAGKPPYSGQTMLDVLHKHQFGQYDRPTHYAPECPRWLEDVIAQLLDKDPAKRLADAYVTGRRLREIPKKVDLSQSEPLPAQQAAVAPASGEAPRGTESLPPTERSSVAHDDLLDSKYVLPSDAPTRTAYAESESGGPAPPRGPGEATLMHALMREEIDRQQEQNPIQKFFDNTWVLVGLLVLVLAGGWVWYSNLPTPQTHYEDAQRLIKAGEYSTARVDHLFPLLTAGGDWPKKARALIDKTRALEDPDGKPVKSDTSEGKTIVLPDPIDGEAGRLLQEAKRLAESGQTAAARRQLNLLIAVTAGADSMTDVHQAATEFLKTLQPTTKARQSRESFIREILERVARLREVGQTAEAEALIAALEGLYQEDPGVQAEIEEIRQWLEDKAPASG